MQSLKVTEFSLAWTSDQDSAKPKSAFVLSSLGKYQFNRVPLGLAQAPAYFEKLINDVLKGCNFAMGYLDDIIIYSRSEK